MNYRSRDSPEEERMARRTPTIAPQIPGARKLHIPRIKAL
jgi:hypothetical protein